jgi:flagellar biosynthesis protein FliQ
MTADSIVEIIRQALMTAFWLSLPLLLTGFVVSIIVSLVQILTSIQDPTFSSIPRLGVFLLAFLISLPWMLGRLASYAGGIFGDLARYAH